ncbi:MAG: DUF4149 domain-containing protein [bacterium]
MSARSHAPALASIVLLAAWLGAAVFVAAVIAPAAFAVLPTRALAGAIVGRALPVLFTLGVLIGAAVALLNQGIIAPRMVTLGAAMLSVMSASALMVEIRLRGVLTAIGTPIDALDPSDPRRAAFGRLHGVSVLLMGVGVVGASLALLVLTRHLNARSAA